MLAMTDGGAGLLRRVFLASIHPRLNRGWCICRGRLSPRNKLRGVSACRVSGDFRMIRVRASPPRTGSPHRFPSNSRRHSFPGSGFERSCLVAAVAASPVIVEPPLARTSTPQNLPPLRHIIRRAILVLGDVVSSLRVLRSRSGGGVESDAGRLRSVSDQERLGSSPPASTTPEAFSRSF